MIAEFTSISAIGKFDCECSLDKTTFDVSITPKHVKLICMKCMKVRFYRRVESL